MQLYHQAPQKDHVEHGAGGCHSGAEKRLVRQACDDLGPVAKAQHAGKKKVAGALQQVECGKDPEEVTQVGPRVCSAGGEEAEHPHDEIDESAAGVDESIIAHGVEVIAGQLRHHVAAQPRRDAVSQTLVKQRCRGGGQYRERNDCDLAVASWHLQPM